MIPNVTELFLHNQGNDLIVFDQIEEITIGLLDNSE